MTPLEVTADHVKLYKRALLEAGLKSATMARRLSVLRGTYHQLAAKGLIAWETAQDIGAVKAPPVQKNSTPSLTERQAISLLEAIPIETLQGIRDLALMSVFYITGCWVSAIVQACVGHLETDGVEHYLNVTEKRGKKRRKIFDTAHDRITAARWLRELRRECGQLGLDLGSFFETYDRWKTKILNYFDARQTSAAVEGINNKARVITKRTYGLKSAKSLWDRLILDLNRASQAIGYSIEHIRQMAKGLKALFDWSCT